jgi:heptosyltransferase-2
VASTKPNIVIQTAFLGDLLLAIPLFKHLKQLYPSQKLYLVCREGLGGILKSLELVDEVFEIKKSDRQSYKKILKTLNKTEFQILICPHESLRSALFTFQLKASKKISYDHWWNFFVFNETITRDLNLPDPLRQLSLISSLEHKMAMLVDQYSDEHSISSLGPIPEWASMALPEKINFQLPATLPDAFLGFSKKIICLFPGSVWATKQWKIDGFIELARRFKNENYEVVILGSKPELSLGQAIANAIPGVHNLIAQTSLQETLALLKVACVVVTNDSAGQHLAAVAGTATVSLFGPTVLDLGYRPWNPKALVVENKTITCRPCGKHGHKTCPIGTHICMTMVTADQVWEAVKKLL